LNTHALTSYIIILIILVVLESVRLPYHPGGRKTYLPYIVSHGFVQIDAQIGLSHRTPYAAFIQHSLPLLLHPSVDFSSCMSTRPTKERAYWTTEDENTLLLFLIDHKSEGDSGGFKKTTWNAATFEVNKKVSRGEMKTADACKAKFRAVCLFFARFKLFY
jgi:hypothetical protein